MPRPLIHPQTRRGLFDRKPSRRELQNSRARHTLCGRDTGDVEADHDIGVRDQSVPKARR